MIDLIGVEIPKLRRRCDNGENRPLLFFSWLTRGAAALFAPWRFAGAAQPALAAALFGGAVLSAVPVARHWLASPSLSRPWATIHPEARSGADRLSLAAEASRGQLRWDGAAAPAPLERPAKTDWSLVLRARSRSALAQARAALVLSRVAAAQTSSEAAAEAAESGFSQRWSVPGADAAAPLIDALASAPLLAVRSAPDVTAKNATPYQEMLDTAYAEAQEAGRLGRRAPLLIAAGTAMTAEGRSMLGVPGAALAAKALLAAGAAALQKGLTRQREARLRLKRARRLAVELSLFEGQKAQSALASACVEALASGASLDRCRGDAPPMTADVAASVDREIADDPVWEVEGGRLAPSAR